MTLPQWSRELSDTLGLDLDVDVKTVLDLARDAAHQVERPAAPLTAFLVGYAAGVRGGTQADIAACVTTAQRLIAEHAAEDATTEPPLD